MSILKRGRHVRRNKRALKVSTFTAVFLLGLSATAVFADGGALEIEVANDGGYAKDTTDDGAIVEYIGEDSAFGGLGASGTGVFESYLRTQASPAETGYNTDGALEFDTKAGAHTHSIKVSEIPVVECVSADGLITTTGLCWELFADVNDTNGQGGGLMQLTDLEIWFTADASLTGYPFPGTATNVYDFSGTVKLNDVNQGSGRGDVRYLIPLTGITIPTNCDFGNAACATYFVTYTGWGDPAGGAYSTSGGFNEWKVKNYPFLSVEKTATTTFTRTFGWTIDKSVNPATWDLFDGDTGTSQWTVAVTKDDGTDSGWAVSGTITIENPSELDAVLESVTDSISGVGNVTVDCGVGVTFPYDLDEGDSLVCTYSRTLPDGTNRTNTATATLDTSQVFTGDAAVTFGAPTTLVNDTVDVTDTNGESWEDVADDATFNYDETFECGDDEGTHNNTATITQTGQNDSASVTVNCYDLTVVKTANESFSRDFDWTVEKSVDPTSLDLFNGDSDTVEWTVEWTKGAAENFGYAVSGSITITNNHPSQTATINSVTDSISGVGSVDVDCDAVMAGNQTSGTIAAGGNLVCTYSSALPDDAMRTNTASATQQNYDYASDLTATDGATTQYGDTEPIDFTGVAPTVTDDTATLSDARPGNTVDGDVVSASGSESWSETFECDADEGDHTNNVLITEDDSLDTDPGSATTTVNCYELTVTKDADTTFTRDYDWDIAKTRFIADGEEDGDGDPLTLTLMTGQTFVANYEVTVTMTGFTDSDHAVSGTITISNPAPMVADDVSVIDVISHAVDADINAAVDCDDVTAGNQSTVDVPAAVMGVPGTATCEYSADLPNADARTNTATATLFDIDYSGTAAVTFDLDNPTVEIDECVDVIDDAGTPGDTSDDIDLETVCLGDLDENNEWSDTYTMDIGPFEACGEYTFTNTVSLATSDDENDTEESDDATYTVTIDIPCPEGCSLTQGYWKTHNDSFHGGAPTDDTWSLIGPLAEDEIFYLSGQTYFEVMWTAPQGNVYYNLASQYIAAVLNGLSGADTSDITTELAAAESLFETYTPADIAALKGKNGNAVRAQFIALAGTLGSYNEGEIGPGHCDEDGTSAAVIALLPGLLAFRRRDEDMTF